MKNTKVFNFKVVEPPKIKEVRGKDWIYYGADNQYSKVLQDLSKSNALHSSILKSKVQNIIGEGLQSTTHPDLLQYANSDGESWDYIFENACKDYVLYGFFALNIVHTNSRESVEVFNLDAGNVRMAPKDEDDRIPCYYYSTKWNNTKKYPPRKYEKFSMISEDDSTIWVYGTYEPGLEYYPAPPYAGGLASIALQSDVERYHQHSLQNGFTPSIWVNIPSQPQNEDEVREIYRQLEDNYTMQGSEGTGASKFILTFSDGADLKPDIQTISTTQNDKYYLSVIDMTTDNILAAHRITSPMLLGLKTEGQLGGKNEILEAQTLFEHKVIRPDRKCLLDSMKKFLRINAQGQRVDLSVIQSPIFDDEGELNI